MASHPPWKRPTPPRGARGRPVWLIILGTVFTVLVPHLAHPFAGCTILGRVVDQATGEPLCKVKIVLRPSDLQAVTGD